MTAVLSTTVDDTAVVGVAVTDVFDLDLQVETEPALNEVWACQTDDGCGQTCEISACHSQK